MDMTPRTMLRRCVLIFGGICLSATVAAAKQGVIHTRDGRTIEGDITEKDDAVIVQIRGIETTINRGDIDTLNYEQDIEKEYQQRLAKLDAKDVKGRLQLARWAFDHHNYPLARDAANKALEIDPNSREATDFLQFIRSQQQLEANQRRAATPPAAPSGNVDARASTGGGPVAIRSANEIRTLSADDVNKIRQQELQRSDGNVRVRFTNNVQKRYASYKGIPYADFTAQSQAAQAYEIIHGDDPHFAEDVRILSDPMSLLEYRTACSRWCCRIARPRDAMGAGMRGDLC
jgi:hypothetical protein